MTFALTRTLTQHTHTHSLPAHTHKNFLHILFTGVYTHPKYYHVNLQNSLKLPLCTSSTLYRYFLFLLDHMIHSRLVSDVHTGMRLDLKTWPINIQLWFSPWNICWRINWLFDWKRDPAKNKLCIKTLGCRFKKEKNYHLVKKLTQKHWALKVPLDGKTILYFLKYQYYFLSIIYF